MESHKVEAMFRRVGLEPKTINGKPAVILGNFTITFYNYYFIVNGDVPLEVAKELYAIEPIGRTDIRSGGDCGCRPPVTWAIRRKNGRMAVDATESNKLFEKAKESAVISDLVKDSKYYFCGSDEEYAALPAFVENYHIDSELGLYIFIQTLKAHKLV